MRDYRQKDVKGLVCDVTKMRFQDCDVKVQMTNDSKGQSLSLRAFNIMIQIPLEQVADIIKVVERNG